MTAAENVIKADFTKPAKLKLYCEKCGSKGEMGCGCGVGFIRATDFAAQVVADPANANKSTRDLAAETGVSQTVITKARRKSVELKNSPARVTGKDGKSYAATKPRAEIAPQAVERERRVELLMGAGKSSQEIADDLGVGLRAANQAMEHVRIRQEAMSEAGINIDPNTLLSLSARQKLDIVIRQQKRQQEQEYAQRMRGLDEEVRQRVLAESKEYLDTLNESRAKVHRDQAMYDELINNNKPIFTVDQFNLLRKCLHQSGIAAKPADFDEAFRLIQSKKLQLTGER